MDRKEREVGRETEKEEEMVKENICSQAQALF